MNITYMYQNLSHIRTINNNRKIKVKYFEKMCLHTIRKVILIIQLKHSIFENHIFN